eukprot:TRINITY_DN20984_c0_g1_i1.p1 TRINITY_DN20984_c0_g1~~TRINITY_DN20984_c0_g1_i1.p1  ORF type:complete len:182 (-),score=29.57 TRINITY_DN20984_c0_g1_i1:122-667(-)
MAKRSKDEAGATPTPKKSKKDNKAAAEAADGEDSKEVERRKWANVCAIAKPLADKSLNKRCLKLVKKAAKNKGLLRRGVKEVAKAIRKGEKGVCILGGDISPIDVISHLPIVCEEASIPYVYVPSRSDLGTAAITKRPTSCVLVLQSAPKGKGEVDEEFLTEFKEVAGACQEKLNEWLQNK